MLRGQKVHSKQNFKKPQKSTKSKVQKMQRLQ